MKFASSFAAATTAIIGLSKHSLGFVYASKSVQRQFTKKSPSFVRMSSTTQSTTPDVTRFMSGDRPEGTKDYIMQQTMFRVKDPVKSLEFYCDVLGFKLVMYREFPQWGFNVYVRKICLQHLKESVESLLCRFNTCGSFSLFTVASIPLSL